MLTKVETAHKRREVFLDVHGKSRMVEIRILYEMAKNEDYESLGFESFKDYVQAPRNSGGLDISRAWAIQLIETYKKYVVELKQPETLLIDVSPRKLYFLKEKATKENVDEIVSQAENMSLLDLQRESKGVDLTTCEHKNIKVMRHCLDCMSWLPDEEN